MKHMKLFVLLSFLFVHHGVSAEDSEEFQLGKGLSENLLHPPLPREARDRSDVDSTRNFSDLRYAPGSPPALNEPNGEASDYVSFDIDGNGEYDALTDGLLILRGMLGLTGAALIDGVIADNAVYTTAGAISSRLGNLGSLVDIDGNGQIDALTDGLVILKYLFGLRGHVLIDGVVAPDAPIFSVADIDVRLSRLFAADIALISDSFTAGAEATFLSKGSEKVNGLNFLWNLQKPEYSLADISGKSSISATFRPDAIGEYTLTFSVTDSEYGTTSITKSFTPNMPSPDPLPNYDSTSPPTGVIDGEADAARFLIQATFGPTVESVEDLLEKGGEAWFNEQLNLPYTSWMDLRSSSWIEDVDPLYSRENGKGWLVELFSQTAQSSPDQLRHRVAYSLSQLFVVSAHTVGGHNEIAVIDYYDVLGKYALGNFRDLLEAVTLHPTMGQYLGMLGNQKADPENNIRPDENFAREIMQLFTIGLRELNQDGSIKLDSRGEATETYNQDTITQYAAALTGWYFDTRNTNHDEKFACTNTCFPIELAKKPMVAFDHIHQKTEKQLLRGYYVPPGQSADQDVKLVLDSLFNHPNLAPFFSMHLIKQMVTSNPSPRYVERVSAVFNNNGQGVRGDIGATVKAVLFDDEARNPNLTELPYYGKVKEPLMFITHLNRLFDVTLISPEGVGADNLYAAHRWMRMADEPSQRALYAESVFNFFRPDFAPNGEIADMGLVAPEMQILTEDSIVNDIEMFRWMTTREVWEEAITNGRDPNQFSLAYDFSQIDEIWEREGYPSVIDYLSLYMTGDRMGSDYKNNLLSFASDPDYGGVFDGQDPSWSQTYTDQMQRHNFLIKLVYLIITTPEFRVQQ